MPYSCAIVVFVHDGVNEPGEYGISSKRAAAAEFNSFLAYIGCATPEIEGQCQGTFPGHREFAAGLFFAPLHSFPRQRRANSLCRIWRNFSAPGNA